MRRLVSQRRASHLCGGLSICACQRDNTLVNLDPRDDAFLLQDLHEWCAICAILVKGLLKQYLHNHKLDKALLEVSIKCLLSLSQTIPPKQLEQLQPF